MARYFDEQTAAADGIVIEHDVTAHQFTVRRDGAELGRAHYTLIGDDAIDFDGTVVDPELRGTGVSGLLAHRAMSDEVVKGRAIHTSCWFMEGYLKKHPELAETGAAD